MALFKVSCICNKICSGDLKRKLSEVGLEDEVAINIIQLNSIISIASFNIEIISMTHSILEPASLIIKQPQGKYFIQGIGR